MCENNSSVIMKLKKIYIMSYFCNNAPSSLKNNGIKNYVISKD